MSIGTNIWNWGFLGRGNMTAWTASHPAGLTSWYDASNGPTPTTAESTLTGWNDLSVTANHLTNIVGAPKISSITQNGLPMVYFDGSSSINGLNKADSAQPITSFLVFMPTAWGTGGYQIMTVMDASNIQLEKVTGATNVSIYSGFRFSGESISNNTQYVLTAVFNGATSSIAVNNHTLTSGDSGTNGNSNSPLIGQAGGNVNFFTGYIMEWLVYDGALSADDQAIVRNYLNNKWAIY